jgi:uncharacterized protein YecE (DUF72 family)
MPAGQIIVGTSGYRYWPGDIHPPKTSSDEALRRYSDQLGSVELNRTFYQLPRARTVANWQRLVPKSFVWSIKIWRRISHEKKLIAVREDWRTFCERLSILTAPSGVLLLQLPKTFPHEVKRLEQFLSLGSGGFRLAIEFRHPFWFCETVYNVLKRHGVALVGVGAPTVERVLDARTAPFTYYRLHGPREWYKDRYSLEEMQPFVDAARRALRTGDVYVYFDNTIGGHAFWNALEFRAALAKGDIRKMAQKKVRKIQI